MLYREDNDVLSWLMGEEEREGKRGLNGSSGLDGPRGDGEGGMRQGRLNTRRKRVWGRSEEWSMCNNALVYSSLLYWSCISCCCCRFFEWDRKIPRNKQPYFIFFSECGPTEEMRELSSSPVVSMKESGAESAVEAEDKSDVMEGGVASSSMSEELDLDQVKGRMLTMAGLFDIWRNDEVRLRLFVYLPCYCYVVPASNQLQDSVHLSLSLSQW